MNLVLLHLLDGLEVFIRIHVRHDVGIHVDELHLIDELLNRVADIGNGHIAGVEYPGTALVLVPGGGRHNKKHIHSVVGKSLDYAFTGCSESARDMRRELPTEHQYFHFPSSLYLSRICSTVSRAAVLSAEDMAPCGA